MEIRQFQIEDLPSCGRLFAEEFNLSPWNDNWTLQKAEDHLREVTNYPNFDALVVEDEGKIIGMLLGHRQQWWNGMEYVIDEMCVTREYQRHGIGSLLLRKIKDLQSKVGVVNIRLWTLRASSAADFYTKHGFTEMRERQFFELEI